MLIPLAMAAILRTTDMTPVYDGCLEAITHGDDGFFQNPSPDWLSHRTVGVCPNRTDSRRAGGPPTASQHDFDPPAGGPGTRCNACTPENQIRKEVAGVDGAEAVVAS